MKKAKIFVSLSVLCLSIAALCMGILASQSVTYSIQGTITYTAPILYNGDGTSDNNLSKYIATQLSSNVSDIVSVSFTTTKPTETDLTTKVNVGWESSSNSIIDSYVAYCTMSSNMKYYVVIYSSLSDIIMPKNSAYMFSGCSNLTSINIQSADFSGVEDISGLFNGCSGLTEIGRAHV